MDILQIRGFATKTGAVVNDFAVYLACRVVNECHLLFPASPAVRLSIPVNFWSLSVLLLKTVLKGNPKDYSEQSCKPEFLPSDNRNISNSNVNETPLQRSSLTRKEEWLITQV